MSKVAFWIVYFTFPVVFFAPVKATNLHYNYFPSCCFHSLVSLLWKSRALARNCLSVSMRQCECCRKRPTWGVGGGKDGGGEVRYNADADFLKDEYTVCGSFWKVYCLTKRFMM